MSCGNVCLRPVMGILVFAFPIFAAADRADLEGNWLQLDFEMPEIRLTAAGEAAVANYEPLRDDPDLQCKPASLTNVITIPDPPFAIRLHDGHVEFNFEYMDVRQRVPIDSELLPEDAPYTVTDHPHLGRSNGSFDGDSLVIETVDPEAGFLNTLRAPYPQSRQMRTVGRFTANGDRLHVDITHTDPVIYREPFVISFEFFRVDFEILEFGCTIDAANYDDRL
jgi:hypothetical protein